MSDRAKNMLNWFSLTVDTDCPFWPEDLQYYQELKDNGYIDYWFPTGRKGIIRVRRLK